MPTRPGATTVSAEAVVRLAARGDGVTASGRYVAGAVPGDLVRTDQAGVVTVEPGPDHIQPPCRHYPSCGGCQLQHLSDRALAAFVTARVEWALANAGLTATSVQPVHLSPPYSRRRASLRAVRTGGGAVVGFNAEGTHQLIDLAECHVLHPSLFALVAPLRELLPELLPPRGAAGITMTLTSAGVDLLLANVPGDTLRAIEALTAFATAHDLARLSLDGSGGIEIAVERRAPVAMMGGVPVRLPPAAFLQATADGEAALSAAVLSATAGAARTADLFAGVGTFALPLSRSAEVLAADASGPAMAALAAAALANNRRVRTLHRDLFRKPLSAAELDGFDAVVFDPPRTGAAAQVTEIARSSVPVVVAVSCNPNTFARDAAALVAGGYRVGRVWPVGQFRWSTHVELVAEFRR